MSRVPYTASERAIPHLRAIVMDEPRIQRDVLIEKIHLVTGSNRPTIVQAVQQMIEEGYLVAVGNMKPACYIWTDHPKQIDFAPRVVKRLPADQAPRVEGSFFRDAISWGMHYCLGVPA